MFNNSQCYTVQLRFPAHISTSGNQSLQDMQALHVANGSGPQISVATGGCGELCKMASLVALRSLGMAADRGLPTTHPTMSGLAPILTETAIAPAVLNEPHSARPPPGERTVAMLPYHCPRHFTAQSPQTPDDIVPN